MVQCNVYDWTLAGYKFSINKDYDLHTELHLNNRNYGYIRVGFIDNGETRDTTNAHIIYYNNENGYPWAQLTRANGNETVHSTAFSGKPIKYNEWVDVDFKLRHGAIYASYKTTSTDTNDNRVYETIQDQYIGTMDYDFWFTMSSWISTSQGIGCRKFVVNELE